MLYIRGHKIIKGYIGNTPVSHVGFGKSGLIKIKSENGGSDYPNNLMAKYTTNTSGVLPVFNSGYQYTINETESNGVYTVELFSDTDFTSCSFNGKTQLLTVEYLKVTDKVTNMKYMFKDCNKLTLLDVSNFNTSNVTNMNGMFRDCTKLKTIIGLNNFDVSKVTYMNMMFHNLPLITSLDLSSWNTDSLVYTTNDNENGGMFSYCSKLQSITFGEGWNTSQVTNMKYMFKDCNKLTSLDLSNFNTSNVTDMQYMFEDCNNLTSLDVSNFNTSNVTNMQYMFEDCNNLTSLDVSNFNTSNVTNMTQMINECYDLTELNISNWYLNSEVDVTDIFQDTNVLTNVIMNNSDYNSVNKIIKVLPTRTSEAGCLDVTGVDDISLIDEETLNSKNWVLSNVGH